MMRRQLLNSACGNRDKRGFVFTLDSLIAMIILFVIIGISSSYVSRGESELYKLQLSRTGSDLLTLLENKEAFDSMNSASIGNEISNILPQNYHININLTCANETLTDYTTIIAGEEIPEKSFVASGRRFFVITNNDSADFCMTQYQIWQ